MLVPSAKELIVYQKAYALAMRIFQITKGVPKEETYALISQIRRSSRSICMNLRVAWAKRRYPAHFISKLTDCDGETNETDTSINFAHDCGYISETEHKELSSMCVEIGKILGSMISKPEPWLITDP